MSSALSPSFLFDDSISLVLLLVVVRANRYLRVLN